MILPETGRVKIWCRSPGLKAGTKEFLSVATCNLTKPPSCNEFLGTESPCGIIEAWLLRPMLGGCGNDVEGLQGDDH